MAWQDRIKPAAYTAPNGTRLEFQYTDLSKETRLKGTVFEFPGIDGQFVQRRGVGGRTFPIAAIFSGDNNDLAADAFEAALSIQGFGKLEHPRYGLLTVVPFGAVERKDGMAKDANATVIEVEFFETLTSEFPQAGVQNKDAALLAVESYTTASAEELEGNINIETQRERTSFSEQYKSNLKKVKTFLKPIADSVSEISSEFNIIRDSIDNGITTLIDDPLTLGFQTVLLMRSPAKLVEDVVAQMEAYQNLSSSIISGDGAVRSKSVGNDSANLFETDSFFAMNSVIGMAQSAINNTFDTKPDALNAAAKISDAFRSVSAWRDSNYDNLALRDKGKAYAELLQVVSLTTAHLVEISFTAAQEKILITDRPRSVIDLCFDLYQDVDNRLQFFVESNSLSGAEILEIPKGKRIKYYA